MHEGGGGDNKSKPGKGRRELSQSLILSLIFFPGKNHGYFSFVSFSHFSKILALNFFSFIILMNCGSFQFRSPLFVPFHYLGILRTRLFLFSNVSCTQTLKRNKIDVAYLCLTFKSLKNHALMGLCNCKLLLIM